jgi:hypothetical protein
MSIWAKTSLSGVYSVPSQNALLWNDRSWRAERAFGRRRRESAMGVDKRSKLGLTQI